jgi:DNA-binding NarL/FixJ family response regulator
MFTQDNGESIAFFQGSHPAGGYAVAPSLSARNGGGNELSALCTGLTARQREVLAVMMQGKSNKAICRILNLAEPTVKNHVTAILKALKVSNRTEAVIKVAKASAASMSYSYTISGHSTFLRT